MACWNGPPLTKVSHCLAVRTAATSSGRAHTQPIFQPVTAKVLPPLEMVTVRSAMPGSVAMGMCSPSNTRCSYTSSVTTIRSRSTATAAMDSSSARLNTLPVGLWGLLSTSSRVRGVTAAASSSGSKP